MTNVQVSSKAIFSEGVVLCEIHNSSIGHVPITKEQEQYLSNASENRKWEFKAGRLCAAQAMEKLGGFQTEIRSGKRGEPHWPKGFIGSITHKGRYAAAAVGRRESLLSIGIDVEMNDRLSEKVLQRIALPEELSWLKSQEGSKYQNPEKLLFAAKEAVFKAWFPIQQCWLGFSEAHVAFNEGMETFHVSILRSGNLRSMSGKFFIDQDHILAGVEVPIDNSSHLK
ncbi:MAG: 4'-phosphopantetheinyl transferase [Actinobacteria bacterium]|nr:4'-phosphopantetheinyl transferase [Actinomycetota bacterium]|tara:strand:+ start:16021 stop:16698 length:678 start_codon:yes stop_codon:yes gene_type:complete